jgi:hypothetical protein
MQKAINVYDGITGEFLYFKTITPFLDSDKDIIQALKNGNTVEVLEFMAVTDFKGKKIQIDSDGYASFVN